MKQAKQYFSKMLMLLPLTFLMTPLFYSLLGYHPEVRFLKLFVYIWYAFFIYLGMTLTVIFKRYPYLPYPIVIVIAFLCKNICELPALGLVKNEIFSADTETGYVLIQTEMKPGDFMYLAVIVFVISLIAGFFGAYYTRKTALEFVNRKNTIFLVNFLIILNIICPSVFYIVAFFVSYFLVRNFAYLNRQLEIYAERGVYNVSGTKRIYAYYFSSLAVLMLSLPLLILFSSLIVPRIVNGVGYIFAALVSLVAKVPNPLMEEPTTEFTVPEETKYIYPEQAKIINVNDYWIVVLIFLIILIAFRKYIKELILFIIDFFKTKLNITGYNKAIINQEIITELKRDKKSKSSYRDYLKQVRKIKDLRKKFLFAYNYIFWTVIKKDEVLKNSSTPNEVAEKYEETQSLADLYQDLKYGNKSDENIKVEIEIEKAENYLKNLLL